MSNNLIVSPIDPSFDKLFDDFNFDLIVKRTSPTFIVYGLILLQRRKQEDIVIEREAVNYLNVEKVRLIVTTTNFTIELNNRYTNNTEAFTFTLPVNFQKRELLVNLANIKIKNTYLDYVLTPLQSKQFRNILEIVSAVITKKLLLNLIVVDHWIEDSTNTVLSYISPTKLFLSDSIYFTRVIKLQHSLEDNPIIWLINSQAVLTGEISSILLTYESKIIDGYSIFVELETINFDSNYIYVRLPIKIEFDGFSN